MNFLFEGFNGIPGTRLPRKGPLRPLAASACKPVHVTPSSARDNTLTGARAVGGYQARITPQRRTRNERRPRNGPLRARNMSSPAPHDLESSQITSQRKTAKA
jgi:hypothetical protein